jgi:hypothetical protein
MRHETKVYQQRVYNLNESFLEGQCALQYALPLGIYCSRTDGMTVAAADEVNETAGQAATG